VAATKWPLTCPRIAGHTIKGCLVKVKVFGKVHSIGEVVPMRNGKTFVPVFLLQETVGQAPEVIQLRSFNGFKPKVGEAVEVACDARAYGGEYREPGHETERSEGA
jgi:ribosomal protein S19